MKNFPYTGLLHVRALDYNNFGPSSNGGITIVYDFEREEDGKLNLLLAFSVCSPKDNFSRRSGRVRATDRMNAMHEGKADPLFTSKVDLSRIAPPEHLELLKQHMKSTDNGVLYVKEQDFPFMTIMVDVIASGYLSNMCGEDVEIIRVANNFIVVPVEVLCEFD